MTDRHTHLTPERIQALLDGDIPALEARALRAEVDGCPRCRAEVEAWEVLFQDLGEIPLLEPSPAFRERVLEQLPTPRRQRVLATLFGRRDAREHATVPELQEHLDGRLAARDATRLEEHLGRCAACRTEMEGLHAVVAGLESLPRLLPSPDFGEAVMARFRVQQMAAAALAPTTRRERFLAWAKARVPSSSRGWAAALGAGTAPAVTLALALQAVFSYDLVTFSNLISFLRFKLSGLTEGVGAALARTAADHAVLAQGWEVIQILAGSPTLVAAAAVALSGTSLGAAWVLYRNLVLPQGEEGRYAQASH
ncbi:MAG TPA: zf-HC2 domain-containing protein [Longimicrobiales bacterium]|nr:zf-HC2 domain-containing protein [Longimicrobiales bacterium]